MTLERLTFNSLAIAGIPVAIMCGLAGNTIGLFVAFGLSLTARVFGSLNRV